MYLFQLCFLYIFFFFFKSMQCIILSEFTTSIACSQIYIKQSWRAVVHSFSRVAIQSTTTCWLRTINIFCSQFWILEVQKEEVGRTMLLPEPPRAVLSSPLPASGGLKCSLVYSSITLISASVFTCVSSRSICNLTWNFLLLISTAVTLDESPPS